MAEDDKKGSSPSSPKEGSPNPSAAAEVLPAQHWVQAAEVRRPRPLLDDLTISVSGCRGALILIRFLGGWTRA